MGTKNTEERRRKKKVNRNPMRSIPSIDSLSQEEIARELLSSYPRGEVIDALRSCCETMRQDLRRGKSLAADEMKATILHLTAERLRHSFAFNLRPVINATGIVLHTNLGRAPLAAESLGHLQKVTARYCNLEIDLATGERGDRMHCVEDLLKRLTGAEAALVVNNNAASVLLVLETIAKGREVIVSRGELIEIGGSFRLPEIFARSGALMVEVGTTNKTYLSDYERAITPNTAILFKSHWSNYRIVGFVKQASVDELVRLGREKGILTVMDLGSGLLVDLLPWGIDEIRVQDVVRSGFDLVCFSGDKLLGGPQAGIVVGRRDLIDACARNPLTRALRVDKLIMAALEGTLHLYLDPESLREKLPILRMLGATKEELRKRAEMLVEHLKSSVGDRARIDCQEGTSPVGGGAFPAEGLPTYLVCLSPDGEAEEEWARRLRMRDPPVLARLAKGKVIFDVRSLQDDEIPLIGAAVREIAAGEGRKDA